MKIQNHISPPGRPSADRPQSRKRPGSFRCLTRWRIQGCLFMLLSSLGACVASQMLKLFPALSVCLLQPNSRTILTFLGQCLQTNPSLMLVVSGLVYWWPCALPSWICTQDLTFVTSSQPLATLRGTEMSTSISGRSRPPMDSCTLGPKLGQLGIPPTNSVALAEEAW